MSNKAPDSQLLIKKCKVCSQEVVGRSRQAVYCSWACYARSSSIKRKEALETRANKICRMCLREIVGRRRQAEFCSWDCREKEMEQRRKEEQDRSKPLGVCSQCKREFRCRFRRGELFCSSICKKEFLDGFKAQGTQEKDCLECNEVFRPRTKYQLYCSVKCRGSAFTAAKGLGMDLSEYSQELSKKRGHIIAETSQTTPLFKPSVPDQAPEPVVLEPSHQTAPLEKKELDLAEIQRLAVRSAFLGEE